MTRQDGRAYDELRPIKITTDFVKFPEGSCLIECGDTKVLCCASIEDKTPPHVAEGEGWVTAEYSMLPRANRERSRRDIDKLKLSGRSAEIQRLIGRSLRAAVDMSLLGERTITRSETEDKDWINNWKQYFKQHAIKWVRASAPSRASMLQ